MEAIGQFVPLLIILALQAVLAWPMVKRKGLGIGTFALCMIPSLGFIAIIWVASKTDIEVLKKLERLDEAEKFK